jgi:hypothetical protein
MLVPKRAPNQSHVHVVRSRLSPAEKLATEDFLFTSMRVSRRLESFYIVLNDRSFRVSGKDVNDGLCGQAGYRRTSGVLDRQGQTRDLKNCVNSFGFFRKEIGPSRIVCDYSNGAALET